MLNNLPADDPHRTPFYVTVQETKHVDIMTFQHKSPTSLPKVKPLLLADNFVHYCFSSLLMGNPATIKDVSQSERTGLLICAQHPFIFLLSEYNNTAA